MIAHGAAGQSHLCSRDYRHARPTAQQGLETAKSNDLFFVIIEEGIVLQGYIVLLDIVLSIAGPTHLRYVKQHISSVH